MNAPAEGRLAHITCGGPSDPWEALGFTVDEGRIALANGSILLDVAAERIGLTGLAVAGRDLAPGADLEGVPLAVAEPVAGTDHPNGAFELDHVVLMTGSLERTSAAVAEVLGLEQRRVRDAGPVRQAFHRFAPSGGVRGCIVEIVERPDHGPTELWGLVVNVVDLDAVAAEHGPDVLGRPKPAVQRGRRIATVRAAAGLGVPLALMSPGR